MPEHLQVEVDGRTLRVSNLDKVLYPSTGTTKADVLRYYLEVAPALLPHLAGRPVTLRRYPDGVDGEAFFQKHCPDHRPDWLETIAPSVRAGRDPVDHCALAEPAALAWTANLGALELHTPMGRRPDTRIPTAVVFDLDPGAQADVLDCAWLALELRSVLTELGLDSFTKTSGGKGLQVYVPLNDPTVRFDDTRSFSHALARLLQRQHPDRIVTTQTRSERAGKVLIDWTQNHPSKTTVCVYSLRGRAQPTASVPLRWPEVQDAHDAGSVARLRLRFDVVAERIATHGDLFAPVLALRQQLPALGGGRPERASTA